MKAGGHKKLKITLISIFSCLVLIYLAGVWYFHYHLLPGSRINGRDTGWMRPGEAEKILADHEETILLRLPAGKTETLTGSSIGLSFDYSEGLKYEMKRQTEILWFIPETGERKVFPRAGYDNRKLQNALLQLPEFGEEETEPPQNAYMELEKGKAVIIPEVAGTRLDTEKAIRVVEAAIIRGEHEIDLDKEEYLLQPDLKADSRRLVKQTEKINRFLSTTVTYWLYDGTSETLDGDTLCHWLKCSDDGCFYYLDLIDLKIRCNAYVKMLAHRKNRTYDTVEFRSTQLGRRLIPAEHVKFGYEIDETAETEELYQNLVNHLSTVRKPNYSFAREFNDFIRSGYVEVDLVHQKVYCYMNGALYYTCDCVTGLYSEQGRHTPVGVYSIQEMGREVTLKGRPDEKGVPRYESHVAYWMCFYGGYGLHDATWQSAFGGERYKTHGSHGCVNLDYYSAGQLYSVLEVGMPVIVVGEEAYE